MYVNQNNMTYDSGDPRCQLFLADTSASRGMGNIKIAFLTVVDDKTQMLKRYFGVYSWEDEESSIAHIMKVGGKWPGVFASKVLPESGELYE